MGRKDNPSDEKDGDGGKTKVVTPLPKIQVLCICTVQMSEAMNVELLFPFLAFMVEDMGYTGTHLGYHAGILAAAFCGAQFCTSVAWGVFSDRYGRKAAIVLGTLGAGLGMLVFGFAKTFPQAILGRIIGGLLCGNLGVVKSFLTEITDDTNRSSAFYLFSLSWAVGSVLAPLVGGMLCKPTVKYPTVFPAQADSIWAEYPYLLPCLLVSCVSAVSALLCQCFMIETVGASKEEIRARINGTSTSTVHRKDSSDSLVQDGSTEDGGVEMRGPVHRNGSRDSSTGGSASYSQLPLDTADIDEESGEEREGTTNALHLQSPSEGTENEDIHPRWGGTGNGSPKPVLSPVPEEYPVASLSVPLSASASSTSMGVSTAVPHGRARNRSRSSSNPVPFIDLEQQPYRTVGGSLGALISETHYNSSCDGIAFGRRDTDLTETDSRADTIAASDASPSSAGEGYDDAEAEPEEEMCCPGLMDYLSCGSLSRSQAGAMAGMDASIHSSQQLLSAEGTASSGAVTNGATAGKPSVASVLMQRSVVLAVLNYGMICGSSIVMDETVPLFLKEDTRHGGFGFSSSQIGTVLSTGAAGMMILTVVCLPLTEGVSNKWLSFMSLGWSIPLELAFPLMAIYNNEALSGVRNNTEHMWLLWPLLMVINAVRNYFTCLAFTSSIMMVNHSVYDEYLGAVNGLGQSLGALARSMGPAVGGLLWSIGTRYDFVYLNFIAVTLLYVVNIYVSDMVPHSLDYKKRRRGGGGSGDSGEGGGSAAGGHM